MRKHEGGIRSCTKSPDRSAYHVNGSPAQSITILEKIIEVVRKVPLTVDMQNLAIQFKSVSPLGLMTYKNLKIFLKDISTVV